MLLLPKSGEKPVHSDKAITAVENRVTLFGLEICPSDIERNATLGSERTHRTSDAMSTLLVPRFHGSVGEAPAAIGNDLLKIDLDDAAEPLALRAGAVRIVE